MHVYMSAGVSSLKLAISEIGVTFPDNTFGEESRFGVPFTVCTCPYCGVYDSL